MEHFMDSPALPALISALLSALLTWAGIRARTRVSMSTYIESGFKSLLEEKKAETKLLEAKLENAYRREQVLLSHMQRHGVQLPKGYIPFGNIEHLITE